MNDTETLPPEQPQALVVREKESPSITPAQAKVDAIAALTMKAYDKASTLLLTPDEVKSLEAEFTDEAFKLGAGGNPDLIYIEHAYLRDRLNKVFGPGQWAIIPRNRWAEEFTTAKNEPATRIYVEAMLMIRGCFVSEAVGDMVYYPKNANQNYGDAVEGAKSACLRRCAKELGIGLQAWKKDFCIGWKNRNGMGGKRQAAPEGSFEGAKAQFDPQSPKTPPAASKARETAPQIEWPSGDVETEAVFDGWTVKKGISKTSKKPYELYILNFTDGEDRKFEVTTFKGEPEKMEVLKGQFVSVKHKPDWKGKGRELIVMSPCDDVQM